ncbi:MAG: aminotransferase class V-fold PLP-dependent enzyme [Bifidobacteriaceae bacterium]|nr:aminotransferase class V-fold PLP-dependent enzyme [Bifidobacteriaceae bacterium]
MTQLTIPEALKPADGRFGSGPSLVRPEQLAALTSGPYGHLMGTSHRQSPVKSLVRHLRESLAELFAAPAGYEVLLGNGGSTTLWDALAFGLIEHRSVHGAAGEFGNKFAMAVSRAPFLAEPVVARAEPGQRAWPLPAALDHTGSGTGRLPSPGESTELWPVPDSVDVFAWPHNETSTGVVTPVERPAGSRPGQLIVIDGTSAAGGIMFDPAQADFYYFAPQKNFGSDGGLWLALASPAAIERIERIAASGRWVPDSLSLKLALDNSRLDQTLNTPALATLVMTAGQADWILDQGGLTWADGRTRAASSILYDWAEARPEARPFVAQREARSPVVVTVDFDPAVDAAALARALRSNGIVDVEPYRKLGRNQLRIATFVNRDPADCEALTASVDYLLDRM